MSNEHLKSEKWMRGRMSHRLYRVVHDSVHGFVLQDQKGGCYVMTMDTDPAVPNVGEWWERPESDCHHWSKKPRRIVRWSPDGADVLALSGRTIEALRKRVRCGCLAPVNFGLDENTPFDPNKTIKPETTPSGSSKTKPFAVMLPKAERCKYAQPVDTGVEIVYTDTRGLDADMRGLRSGSPEMVKVETLMGQQIIDDVNKAQAVVKRRVREWPVCPYGGTVNLMRMKASRLGFKCNRCGK